MVGLIDGWIDRYPKWIRGFLEQNNVKAVDPQLLEIDLGHCHVRILRRSNRSLGVAHERTLVLSAGGGQYFDAGEWLSLLDGSCQEEVEGKKQLEILERLEELNALRSDLDALTELRKVREAWVSSRGPVSSEQEMPVLPKKLNSSRWLKELDDLLIGADFTSGWLVEGDSSRDVIGVVRQKGPLRIQSTIWDSVPLVQVAVWPLSSWVPIDLWSDLFRQPRIDIHSDASSILKLAERCSDYVFSTQHFPNTRRKWRIDYFNELSETSLGLGPSGERIHYQLRGPGSSHWIDMEQFEDIYNERMIKEDVVGGPDYTCDASKGLNVDDIPATFLLSNRHYCADTTGKKIIEQFAPDASWFEFNVEGRPFFECRLQRSSIVNVTDPKRSKVDSRGKTLSRQLAVDPRQMGRPGHVVQPSTLWVCDERFKDEYQNHANDLQFEATWNKEFRDN